ncbi:MAG: RNA methyltransferase [Candidatus Magasanikbacteria bacterium CG10_big_fil_rev_8_21_14_0_10_40_10]|uniref:RNA methyltransferase n=1 Tax=Candidatus Magasanikbacteria bacterium CG10_big_fil_rev_8_21_14_0_10_40_10 TaxID=1974648 RepID=A0A2M6W3W1_9BACT|nr:MAG: RNA methyltransferase [Candidatus Magasanikbacteria bacterium CG10_big_fil_rev_8_21_14_0_10_40_10]
MSKEKFVLILPSIRSGHNVGAMFRTGDAVGVDKIYLTGYTAVPPHRQIDKVSLGAEKWIPFEYCQQTGRLIKKLKKQGYSVVALEQTKNSVNIFKWKPDFPIALIVGNEVRGIDGRIIKLCDQSVHIPMQGRKESLNVSIAAGVALYHIYSNAK